MKPDLETRLSRLPSLETGDLRNFWLELFGDAPHPKLRRELLIPILSYRRQEKALGGLRPATARRLRSIADELTSGKKGIRHNHSGPRAGTRMVRQWQGRLHEVVTLDNGFTYDGQKYRSLSEIARAITGTRWSGPAFFGFKKRSSREAA
ncbi:MAG: DUF2924 domain-containing protein [Acidobacteriaceae bacterium]